MNDEAVADVRVTVEQVPMSTRDMLTALQTLPRDAEVLAFEAGSEGYCERQVNDYLAS
jgi:hypothetical protein